MFAAQRGVAFGYQKKADSFATKLLVTPPLLELPHGLTSSLSVRSQEKSVIATYCRIQRLGREGVLPGSR